MLSEFPERGSQCFLKRSWRLNRTLQSNEREVTAMEETNTQQLAPAGGITMRQLLEAGDVSDIDYSHMAMNI